MKSIEALLSALCLRIGHIYFRPMMYGGSAEGVYLLLYAYHELWAEIMEQESVFRATLEQVHHEQDCGSANFAKRYLLDHPASTDWDASAYVVDQWRTVDKRIGLKVPYVAIRSEFPPGIRLERLFLEES